MAVAELALELFHSRAGSLVFRDALGGAPAGVQDRGVITPTEVPADGRKRFARQLAREIHGHLPRPGYARGARGGEQLLARQTEVLAHRRL